MTLADPLSNDIADPLAPQFDPEDDPARIVSDVCGWIARFCKFPTDHALHAVALWAAHAHFAEHFYATPRLSILSPEPASGKSRALEVLDLLCPASMFCLSASPAAIFRTLQAGPITLLFDEVDAIFSRKGKDDAHEDLRALLNAGHKRNATIPRCVGPKHEVQHFPVFCPVALAGLGDLPTTIMSRSIVIRMRRRAPGEAVESFRVRDQQIEGHTLRERLAGWALGAGDAVGQARPILPPGIEDRPADTWEPVIAVADAAGGVWPARARAACVALANEAQDLKASLGIRLLGDLRTIFGDADALATAEIISRLCRAEDHGLGADAPWSELHGGKPINARGLAGRLGKFEISSKKIRVGAATFQGYSRSELWDAWRRYLPPPPQTAEQAEQTEQTGTKQFENNGLTQDARCGTKPDVPEHSSPIRNKNTPENGGFAGVVPCVPDVLHFPGAESAPAICPRCDDEGCGWCAVAAGALA